MPSFDEQCMTRALELAAQGRGHVEPNPLVGCVIARDGRRLAEGWHAQFGGAHAEVAALQNATESVVGATLYVNLEPCCHVGKTPPCTEAIVRAGIQRVVAALSDPFAAVAGRGIAALRQAGVTVEVGLLADLARQLNRPFLKRVTRSAPWVIAKWAMTLDGKMAAGDRTSRWISNQAAREWVHALRGRMDAIAVGVGTVLHDDPLLTARPPGPRTPLRIVYDRTARIPPQCQLVRTANQVPTWIFTTPHAPPAAVEALTQAGCQVTRLFALDQVSQIQESLTHLYQANVTNLLLEGGAQLQGGFWDAQAIDEVHALIAPQILGDATGLAPFASSTSRTMADARPLQDLQSCQRLDNWHISGCIDWPDSSSSKDLTPTTSTPQETPHVASDESTTRPPSGTSHRNTLPRAGRDAD